MYRVGARRALSRHCQDFLDSERPPSAQTKARIPALIAVCAVVSPTSYFGDIGSRGRRSNYHACVKCLRDSSEDAGEGEEEGGGLPALVAVAAGAPPAEVATQSSMGASPPRGRSLRKAPARFA